MSIPRTPPTRPLEAAPIPVVPADPRPVAYASAGMVVDDAAEVVLPAKAGLGASLAAGWLLVQMLGIAAAFDRFGIDQQRGAFVVSRLLRGSAADVLGDVLRWSAGPLAAAGVFGTFAAAALWHWPRSRLAWAAVVPVVAGVWLMFDPITSRPYGSSSVAVGPLVVVVLVQAFGVVVGTRVGRPVARWLAKQMLPPGLRQLAITLWAGI